ncbi:monovalent cation/H(+) antiporter subunit G [Thermovirga sp.]|uniref:monovalent cation/H(+) antiporter subunit G n=1 Tax=Thermovirga sp. TaxID=2699834 RepID=UPI0025CFCAEF|nr:monovalent cation/H(+) antiporter subunit G [Thermovirga sp.]MBO8153326.1 monovalent cation/H(+) antiporter subunit G [Thermovirga sp.]
MNALIILFLIVGTLFNFLGTVALYRFPDVYTRLHGTTKCTTFGSIFTSAAVVLFALQKLASSGEGRFGTLAVHAVIAVAALLITNPTGAHAIARAAHRSGIMPKFAVVDRLAEDQKKKGGVSA